VSYAVDMDRPARIARLKASKLFGRLTDEWLGRLADEAHARRYEEGEPLWRTGAPATRFTVIHHGVVQIVQPTSGGQEALLGLFGPRESIGDAAVLERGSYPADAIAAIGAAEILEVRAGPILDALHDDASLALAFNRALLDHTRALRAKITVMSAGSVPQRLATLLLHLAERFGDEHEKGEIGIPLPLSRSALARLVGARPETVIRCLSRWQKEGWLRTTVGGFELDSLDPLKEALTAGT